MVYADYFLFWGDYDVYGFYTFLEGDDCAQSAVGNSDEWDLSGKMSMNRRREWLLTVERVSHT